MGNKAAVTMAGLVIVGGIGMGVQSCRGPSAEGNPQAVESSIPAVPELPPACSGNPNCFTTAKGAHLHFHIPGNVNWGVPNVGRGLRIARHPLRFWRW
jgi:hypothetical protein